MATVVAASTGARRLAASPARRAASTMPASTPSPTSKKMYDPATAIRDGSPHPYWSGMPKRYPANATAPVVAAESAAIAATHMRECVIRSRLTTPSANASKVNAAALLSGMRPGVASWMFANSPIVSRFTPRCHNA